MILYHALRIILETAIEQRGSCCVPSVSSALAYGYMTNAVLLDIKKKKYIVTSNSIVVGARSLFGTRVYKSVDILVHTAVCTAAAVLQYRQYSCCTAAVCEYFIPFVDMADTIRWKL